MKSRNSFARCGSKAERRVGDRGNAHHMNAAEEGRCVTCLFSILIRRTWLLERETCSELAPVLLTGLAYGSLRAHFGSIVPSIAAHIGWNAIALAGFLLECRARG